MNKKVSILFVLLLFAGFIFAQVPGKINYQAVIRDASGNAVASSPVNIRFQVFDQIVAGNQVYQEDFTTTTNAYGVVNLVIGTSPVFGNLKALNWANNSFYVNIQMGNPFTDIANSRTQLSSVPYALFAHKSDTANVALSAPQVTYTAGTGISITGAQISNTQPDQQVSLTGAGGINVSGTYPAFTLSLTAGTATPPGIIAAFGGTTAPAGWLMCDGASYATSLYAPLYAAIGFNFGGSGSNFNVPDLRGRFLRGVDGIAGNDPDKTTRTAMAAGGQTGNNVGSVQEDELESHTHQYSRPITGQYPTGNPSTLPTGALSTVQTVPTGGAETRPKNAYVQYIIKL